VGLEEVLPNIELPTGVVVVLLAGGGVGDGGGVVDGLLAGGEVGGGGRRRRYSAVTVAEQAPQANRELREPPRLPGALKRAGCLLLDLDLGVTLPLE